MTVNSGASRHPAGLEQLEHLVGSRNARSTRGDVGRCTDLSAATLTATSPLLHAVSSTCRSTCNTSRRLEGE